MSLIYFLLFFVFFPKENFKISIKQYDYGDQQGIRDKRGTRLTANFTRKERINRDSYDGIIPLPRRLDWKIYMIHRLKMLIDGMATYPRWKYARSQNYDQHFILLHFISICHTKKFNASQVCLVGILPCLLAVNEKSGMKDFLFNFCYQWKLVLIYYQ